MHPEWNQPPWGFCSHSRFGGPSEVSLWCVDDMGLSQADVVDLHAGWSESFDAIFSAMDDAGAIAFSSFSFAGLPPNDGSGGGAQAVLAELCAAGNSSRVWDLPLYMTLSTPASCCPVSRNTTLLSFDEDLAYFQLIRGPWAWLGYSWDFCAQPHAMPPALFVDYGDPLGTCAQVAPGVFEREFEHATARFNTSSYKGQMIMK